VKKSKTDLAQIDELAVEILSDEELEAVTGGLEDATASNSCSCCVAGATIVTKKLTGSES
jgi:bacteriocin-like protein